MLVLLIPKVEQLPMALSASSLSSTTTVVPRKLTISVYSTHILRKDPEHMIPGATSSPRLANNPANGVTVEKLPALGLRLDLKMFTNSSWLPKVLSLIYEESP